MTSLRHLRSDTANKRPDPVALTSGQLAINYEAGSPGLFFKDTDGNLVKAGPVHIGTSAPNATPAAGGSAGNAKGEFWLDTTGGAYDLKIWSGAAWVSTSGEYVNITGDTMTGDLKLDNANLVFEGSSIDSFETTLTVVDPTADNTITLPNVSGTVVTTGDTGTVTSTMIANATIVDADISASAEIAVSKLADGAARQLLQTDAAGTGVEWTNNVDIPGTLDVTGAAVFDSTVNVTGAATVTGNLTVDTNTLFVDATANRVGIIDTSPDATLTVNGVVSHGAGSAGAPSVAARGDLDTGIFFPAANTTGISTGGSERCRVDSSGRLLVGTSTTSATLTTLLQGNSGGATGNAGLLLARGEIPGAAGTVLGALDFSASNHVLASRILCKSDGAWTAGTSQPTRLEFSTTADGASSPTERMRITSNGGVNVTSNTLYTGNSSNVPFQAERTAGDGQLCQWYRTGSLVGNISVTASSTAYNTSSDYRLKENVEPVTDGIVRLQQLKPSRFNFIADPAKTVDGFIAHEVQVVVPEAITGTKDEVDDDGKPVYQGIDQSKLVPLLTAALQEAVAKIESLEARLTAAGI